MSCRQLAILCIGIAASLPAFASCIGAFHDQARDYESYLDAINELQKNSLPGEKFFVSGVQNIYDLGRANYTEAMDVILNIPTEDGTRSVVLPFERLHVPRDAGPFNAYYLSQYRLELQLLDHTSLELPFLYLNTGASNSKTAEGFVFPRRLREKLPLMEGLREADYLGQSYLELDELVTDFMTTRHYDREIMRNGRLSEFVQIFRSAMEFDTGFGIVASEQIPEKDWEVLKNASPRSEAAQINLALTFMRRFNFNLGTDELARKRLEGIQAEFLTTVIEEYDAKSEGIRKLQSSFDVPEGGLFYLTTGDAEPLTRTVYVNGGPIELKDQQENKKFFTLEGDLMTEFKIGTAIPVAVGSRVIRLWPIRFIGSESI